MLLTLWLLPLFCALVYWLPAPKSRPLYQVSMVGLLAGLAVMIYLGVLGKYPPDWSLTLLNQPHWLISLRLHVDALTLSMLTAVLLIGLLVINYAQRYLLADAHQQRFMFWLTALLFAVFTLLMSGNLLTAFIGWQWIGFNLYWLLNHYHYDSDANRAAKKKFVINRVGDVCFLVAVSLSLFAYGNTEFSSLAQPNMPVNAWILGLLLVAAITKSAQFPLHIWLPDTLQTPTPVSAIMHAGVINAGGYLIARLGAAYLQIPALMVVMALVGLVTMFSASWFMASQADTKKRLAYSTMSQMGFMVLQAGLGCFVGALFHLIMHGFYKAWSFLNAGNTLYPTTTKLKPTKLWQVLVALTLLASLALFAVSAGTLWSKLLWQYPLLGFFMGFTLWQLTVTVLRQPAAGWVRAAALTLFYLAASGYGWLLTSYQQFVAKALPVPVSSLSTHTQGLVAASLLGLMLLHAGLMRVATSYRQRLMGWSLRKGGVEQAFRAYLLRPYRALGDRLVNRPKAALALQLWFVLLVILTLAVTKLGLSWQLTQWLAGACAVSMLLLFAAANRANRLRDRCVGLVLGQACLVLITLLLPQPVSGHLALFQLINLGFTGVVLMLIFLKMQRAERKPVVIGNQFPATATYFTIAMFCLIGLPGTSTFVTELMVFHVVLQAEPALLFVLMLGFVLLAVAILHILQDFLFNRRAVARFDVPLLAVEHVIFVVTLGYNVVSGLVPLYFLF